MKMNLVIVKCGNDMLSYIENEENGIIDRHKFPGNVNARHIEKEMRVRNGLKGKHLNKYALN